MKQVKPSFTGAKTLCALALLGAFSAQAQAQSSVTIYGRVVAGVDFLTNAGANGQGSKWSAANNQWGTSMIGFKGTEDLGGGTNAFFLLESGFNSTKGGFNGSDTSSGSALFNRRSYVGLSSATAGSIKFGKNLFINNDVWYLDPTGQQAIGTASLVNGRNWPGASNVIEYASPDMGGFTVGLQTSLGEKPGSFSGGVPNAGSSDGRKDGISLAYQKNGLELRLIYDVVRDVNGNYSDIWGHSKELIIGGTYKFDKLKLFAGYENLRAPDALAGDPDRANHYWIGANYDVTPQFQLVGAVFHVNANNGSVANTGSKTGGGGTANMYMAGINYFLSKRTLLYFDVGTVRNGTGASHQLENGGNTPGASGFNQTGAYWGVAHSF
ncbi:MAG: Outer membrane porin protein 32 [Herbaspirillum frisingense]|uniref:Outer membrane porin protein 32 n=1 Tax=Herbaspirillum frisingense TaxID=92645 RepID=A0A7V8G0A3_9BURK|nr:MAG: Outer membrane porin protein 32 [Herbaspirillum frisingense]